jgi:trk system potassium uptake protein TrkH
MDDVLKLPIVRLTPSRVLVLGFAALIMVGTFLLSLPVASVSGRPLRFVDALFTATSAVCITGLVVKDTGTYFTQFGQTVIIILVQVGGLGFMTMSTLFAILLGKKIGLKERVLIQESFNQLTLAGLVRLIRNVILVTLGLEFVGGLLLSLRFLADFPPARALSFGFFHAIASFCNSGFDLFGQVYGPFNSITHYVADWLVVLVTSSLIVLGGLGFPVIMELLTYHRNKKFSLHTKVVLKITTMLIIVGAVLMLLMEVNNQNTLGGLGPSGKILGAFFLSITPRTAGFSTVDAGQLRVGTWFLFIILMFIGGSPSSTGGGIKTTTFGLVLATVISTIRGKMDVELFERRLPVDLIFKALTIITLGMGWVFFVTLVMSLIEPFEFINLFFEAMSAFSTMGMTTGITRELSDLSLALLMVTMFIGRVGVMTVALALAQGREQSTCKYLEERIIIG